MRRCQALHLPSGGVTLVAPAADYRHQVPLRAGFVLLVRNITAHHTMLVASGVAFSCVFGLIPAMIAVVAVYGLVAEPADVESNIEPLVDALPTAAGDLLTDQLRNLTELGTTQVTIGLVLGVVGVAWAVSSALNAMVMAVRIAHEMPSPHNWIQGRVFALKLSVVGVVSAAAMLWLIVVLPPVLDRTDFASAFHWALEIGRWPLVVVVSMTSLALFYRVVVGTRSGRYHAISVGSVTGTGIWVLSTYLLGLAYTSVDRVESTFGSLGAVAALMAWMYFSALAALIGAEIDALRFDHGRPAEDAWRSPAHPA